MYPALILLYYMVILVLAFWAHSIIFSILVVPVYILTSNTEGPSRQAYAFSITHVWVWELDCEEGWAPKNWCFWTVVLEKTLESPLDCKGIQPVHSEGDQPWDFFGRNVAKAETPVLWPPHAKSWLIGKDSDAGRDWVPRPPKERQCQRMLKLPHNCSHLTCQ